MIEKKFRVWDNVDYMSQPFTFSDIQSKKIEFTSECIVMQFTGLSDKNGKEIYEGDVLERVGSRDIFRGPADDISWTNPMVKTTEVVELKVRADGFGCTTSGYSIDTQTSYSERSRPATYEIIGNIYQNPELLKTPE